MRSICYHFAATGYYRMLLTDAHAHSLPRVQT